MNVTVFPRNEANLEQLLSRITQFNITGSPLPTYSLGHFSPRNSPENLSALSRRLYLALCLLSPGKTLRRIHGIVIILRLLPHKSCARFFAACASIVHHSLALKRMHRCLQLPELVGLVCSHLQSPYHMEITLEARQPRRGDLAALARTSTVFSSHALRLLWKSVTLINLLRCLPSDSFELSTTGEGYFTKYMMASGTIRRASTKH